MTAHHQPAPQRAPEIPQPDDPAAPVEPGPPDSPPQPNPPDVVAYGLVSEEHYYHAEWWHPASWQPHPTTFERSSQLR